MNVNYLYTDSYALERTGDTIKDLMIMVFKKAGAESYECTAYGLARYLEKKLGERIKERTLIRYYDGYILNKIRERKKPNKFSLNVLSEYVGYEDFKGFLRKRIVLGKKRNRTQFQISLWINLILFSLLLFMLAKNYQHQNAPWLKDHLKHVTHSNIDPHTHVDQHILEHMQSLQPGDTSVTIINNGETLILYDKNGHQMSFIALKNHYHPTDTNALRPIVEELVEAYLEEESPEPEAQAR